MKEILLILQRSRGTNLAAIAKNYEGECLEHLLRGGKVRLKETPILLGRAVEKNSFTNHLIKNCSFLNGNRAQAEDLITRLLVEDPLSRKEASLPMSLYATWSTWNEKDPAGDPFLFSTGEAGFIRACLGLDGGRCLTQGLLLFTYTLGNRYSLFRPTVADAGLHRYFKPPDIGSDNHGWTNPSPSTSVSVTGASPISRPEAIHRRQTLSALRAPVRLLPG